MTAQRAAAAGGGERRRRSSGAEGRRDLQRLVETARPDLAPAVRALLVAGVEAFAERGYAATTTREIATRAGMSPAALYVHHPSKESLLFDVVRLGHEQVLQAVRAALAAAPAASDGHGAPEERVRAYVRAFSAWHARQHVLARVSQDELDALTPEHFAAVAHVRHRLEGLLRELVVSGTEAGAFAPLDVGATTIGVLSLGIDVARWFPHTDRAADEVADLHAELAVRMLRAPQAP